MIDYAQLHASSPDPTFTLHLQCNRHCVVAPERRELLVPFLRATLALRYVKLLGRFYLF